MTILEDKISNFIAKLSSVSCDTIKSYAQVTSNIPQGSQPALSNSPNEILDEYTDREQRKCNLILHNIPERKANEATARKHDDMEVVLNVVINGLKLNGITETDVTKLTMLSGRSQGEGDKTCLILIALTTAQPKWAILKWAKYLRETEHWMNIFISPDLIHRGREAGKNLRAEMKRRRNEGEQNLAIRKKTDPEPPTLVGNEVTISTPIATQPITTNKASQMTVTPVPSTPITSSGETKKRVVTHTEGNLA